MDGHPCSAHARPVQPGSHAHSPVPESHVPCGPQAVAHSRPRQSLTPPGVRGPKPSWHSHTPSAMHSPLDSPPQSFGHLFEEQSRPAKAASHLCRKQRGSGLVQLAQARGRLLAAARRGSGRPRHRPASRLARNGRPHWACFPHGLARARPIEADAVRGAAVGTGRLADGRAEEGQGGQSPARACRPRGPPGRHCCRSGRARHRRNGRAEQSSGHFASAPCLDRPSCDARRVGRQLPRGPNLQVWHARGR